MKKINWVCNACADGQCFKTGELKPNACVFSYGTVQKWEPASKRTEAELFDKKELLTPNCAICKWSARDYDNIPSPSTAPNIYHGCPVNYDCLAQGGNDCCRVYNSEECKALFEIG